MNQDLLKLKNSKYNDVVKFPCTQCDYKAKEKGNLLKHIKSIHEDRRETSDKSDSSSSTSENREVSIRKDSPDT